jgi:hypothetical protein
MDRVWIGNCIYWPRTDRNYNYCAIANLHTQQFSTAVLSLLSLLCVHQSMPGNGFQRRTFLKYPHASATSLKQQQLTWTALQFSNSLTHQPTPHFPALHCTLTNCPGYNISVRTAYKTVLLLLFSCLADRTELTVPLLFSCFHGNMLIWEAVTQ